jgi:DNA-binding MarR family transcriptional regulator
VLAPLDITSQEWVALYCLSQQPLSQLEVARLMGVDRTTMVGLVDSLEDKGLVTRRPNPADRRKNLVKQTKKGHDVWRFGERKIDEAEQKFLSALSEDDAQQLKDALEALIERD